MSKLLPLGLKRLSWNPPGLPIRDVPGSLCPEPPTGKEIGKISPDPESAGPLQFLGPEHPLICFEGSLVSGRTEERLALPPDSGQKLKRSGIDRQFEHKRPGMADDPSRHGEERPPHSPERPRPAGSRKKIPPEADEEVVGQDSDPEEHRVG